MISIPYRSYSNEINAQSVLILLAFQSLIGLILTCSAVCFERSAETISIPYRSYSNENGDHVRLEVEKFQSLIGLILTRVRVRGLHPCPDFNPL